MKSELQFFVVFMGAYYTGFVQAKMMECSTWKRLAAITGMSLVVGIMASAIS